MQFRTVTRFLEPRLHGIPTRFMDVARSDTTSWDLFEDLPDPHGVYRWLRDQAPVYKTPRHGQYVLSRYADVSDALLDHATFSSRLTAFPLPEHLPVVNMDPPKHDELRAVVSRPFLPREVAKLEANIREMVVRRLNDLAEKGWGDFVTEFAELVPSDVIGGVLGVDEPDRRRLRRWAGDFLSRDPGEPIAPPRAVAAIEGLKQYFIGLRPQREAEPRDDLITVVSQAKVRGARLSDQDYGAMCAMIAVAGYETTTHLIAHCLLELFKHPEQRLWLSEHTEGIPNAVKEVVRFDSPVPFAGRIVTRDVQLHGVTIPRGSPTVLILASASRDERRFSDPDRFDVRREDADSVGFGLGRHTCFGAPLARLEARIVLEEVLRRYPTYEVDETGVVPLGPAEATGYQCMPIRLRAP